MKAIFAAALLSAAEAWNWSGHGHNYSTAHSHGTYAHDHGVSGIGLHGHVATVATSTIKTYNTCGHHTESDTSDDDYSACDWHTSDYSDNDHGHGYRHHHGRSYYYRYTPRYYLGAYRYGRRYASWDGIRGHYFAQYRHYPVRTYRSSNYYRTHHGW